MIRQIDAAAAAAATTGGSGSWWLLQQEADEVQEVKMFGEYISPAGLFEVVWDVWDFREDVGGLG